MALDVHRDQITRKKDHFRLPGKDELIKCGVITDEFPLDPLELVGEKSFNDPREVPWDEVGTPVQEFYRDATVFLTGGTGFMGKIVLEKLLRSCPHIKHVYLLVRMKKGKPPHERIDEIFQDRLYRRLKHEVPKYYHKVSTVNGDLTLPGLGISKEDRQKLIDEVNVIFHGAATVRFDEKIDVALKINVLGTREIIKLAKQMSKLKVVMYTSTAYSNCPRLEIEEKFYPVPVDYEEVIKRIQSAEDKEELERMTPELLQNWPNTYTFTKAIAENLVQREAQGLPFGILRPAVIISTYREPVRGWIDNVYGPVGVFVGVGTGILHVYESSLDNKTDMVPVDLVANCLICAAVETAEHAVKAKENERDIPIYTYSNGTQNPVTWRSMLYLSNKYSHAWPTIRAVWYYSLTVTDNKLLYTILSFLFHTVPGLILDYLAMLTGRQPMLTKIYTKMANVRETLQYFASREWTFRNDNTQRLWSNLSDKDKELYFFDMGQVSWDYYNRTMCLGLRIYLVNDDIDTLPAARKKWQRLYYAHCALRTMFYCFLVYILWELCRFLFRIFL